MAKPALAQTDKPDDESEIGTPNAGVGVGEYVRVDGGDGDIHIEDLPDGGQIHTIDEPEETPPAANDEFYANLAETLDEVILDRIATDLMQKIEQDKEGRKKRDEQQEEGIKRTGLGKDAPGGAQFEGASKVVHPVMTEACVDFEASVIKEIWPTGGPLKQSIVGKPTAQKAEKAKRKTEYMNYQLTNIIIEARQVLEQTLTQVPLGGSEFIRQWWDHRLHRPRWEFAPIDKIYLPYNAANFRSATRRTYVDTITQVEFRQRVDQGTYRDVQLAPPAQRPEPSKSEKASHKIEGKEDSGQNLDGDRDVYEVMSYLEVTEETAAKLGVEKAGELYPYLISIDEQTKKVLSMYRDWEKKDATKEPIEHLFEFPFIPWRGAYSIGLPQIIGGLSAAATGALRALLDSAHANNAATALIRKGAGVSGQTRSVPIGTMMEVDCGMETDDIRKAVMKFDFITPSPVLYELLGFLVEAAKETVRTSLDETTTAQGNSNVPVGTQLSRVEQGMKVFSAIMGREYWAFDRLIEGLHRLNRLYLPEVVSVDVAGKELMVFRKDFDGPRDTVPVADPTIYSDQQRFAQLAYVQGRSQLLPMLYKQREIEKAGLTMIKWPDPESILQPAPEPHELNAVNENLAMALGKPAIVFPEQDHLAHLQVLLDFLKSPFLGMNPLIAPKYLPLALQHAAEHIVYFYVSHTVDLVEQSSQKQIGDLLDNDDKIKKMLDRLFAMASQIVVPGVQETFSQAMPVLQQAMQAAQALAPKPPMDPALAAVQAAAAETQRKAADDKAGQALDAAKAQSEAAGVGQDRAIKLQELQVDQARVDAMRDAAQLNADTKLRTTEMDNQSAEAIAASRPPGAGGGFKDGASMAGT